SGDGGDTTSVTVATMPCASATTRSARTFPGHVPPAAPATEPRPTGQARHWAASASSNSPAGRPAAHQRTRGSGLARGAPHLEGAVGPARPGPSETLIMPGQRHFFYANDQATPIPGESPRLSLPLTDLTASRLI